MIHLFERAGLKIALDVGSGAVHVLDDASYVLLGSVTEEDLKNNAFPLLKDAAANNFSLEELRDSFEELVELYNAGLLFADDSYKEYKDQIDADAPIKAMCLHMAHDCNLRCKYCFASTGGFGGYRKLMSFDVAKKAIDRLVELSKGRRNLEVDFFGGEPMMNFDVVKQTVEYARGIEEKAGKNFRFTITTNGLLLKDEHIDYINKEMSNVVLSLDGRKEVNDRLRIRVDGSGSYESIVPRFQKLVQSRGNKEYYVRGTYTRYNLDFDKDVLALYDLGFKQISVEPVVGPETDDYSIRMQDIPAIEESYARLMDEMLKRKKAKSGQFNFFHFMVDLDNGPCAIKRLKGCGSGNEYVAVTPDAEIFPCHQFVGDSSFQMGTVEEGITEHEMKMDFAKANLFHKPTCEQCWAKLFCSGGCNANNHTYAGSMYEPYQLACELEKIRLECSIAIQAILSMAATAQ